MARSASLVIAKVNVCVRIISTVKRATNAKKDFTITQAVKNVIVIRLVLLLNLPVVVQYLLENSVSAKSA